MAEADSPTAAPAGKGTHQSRKQGRDTSTTRDTSTWTTPSSKATPALKVFPTAEEFFASLHLASHEALGQRSSRSQCPVCNRSRMYYCYSCHKYLGPESEVPVVPLPKHVHIVKHALETDGKSTAVHAKLVAQADVDMYTFPALPNIVPSDAIATSERAEDAPAGTVATTSRVVRSDRAVLVFPGPQAVTVANLDPASYDDVIVIDSTWHQANAIWKSLKPLNLRCVVLEDAKTYFWRSVKCFWAVSFPRLLSSKSQEFDACMKLDLEFQRPQHLKNDTYLSTIEAIYHFFRQLPRPENALYDGRYDNILFFFAFHHQQINANIRAKRLAKEQAGGEDNNDQGNEDEEKGDDFSSKRAKLALEAK
eukprot:m.73061 g.73061  ORF g.73061 m.73061 type:complete len:365 (-) comp50276_c0_seq1:35-1129(-)